MILRLISAVAILFAALVVLMRSDSCMAGNEHRPRFEEDVYDDSIFETEPETSHTSSMDARAPTGVAKIGEIGRDITTRSLSDLPVEAPTIAPLNREVLGGTIVPTMLAKAEGTVEEVVQDDDYNVVVLDDEVPWDLTEDFADVPSKQVDEQTAPTLAPTEVAPDDDDDNYVVIILEDDIPWDDVAVAEYVKDEFENLNKANNITSEYTDDDYEEDFPSLMPTIVMTPTVSPKPTELTTSSPTTLAPTVTPSEVPSDYPSFRPTESPSWEPSATPTISCHDEVSYHSPINGLSCAQHKNTNCLSWRHIGLNMTELETLVSSCPITCNIDCGNFQLFSAPVSFRISRVAGFMDPKDVDALMKFSIDFLEDFVRKYIGLNFKAARIESNNVGDKSGSNDNDVESSEMNDSDVDEDGFFNYDALYGGSITFEIEAAVLTAQNLVEDNNPILTVGRSEVSDDSDGASRRERQLRSGSLEDLQRTKQQSSGGKSIIQTNASLDVIITFGGFTIGLHPEKMSELLVSGIEGVDFTRELQQSRIDFFSDATVSSATETKKEEVVVEEDIVEDDVEDNSNLSVLISYMVPIVVIGFALGSLFYHRCYVKGGWALRNNVHRQNAIERAQIGGMTATPMAVNTGNDNLASNSNDEGNDGYFNFRRHAPASFNTIEENENARAKKANQVDNIETGNKVEGVPSAFTRLVTAFNFNLALAKSKSSTDEYENKVPDDASNTSSNKSISSAIEELVQTDRIPIIANDLVSPISGDSEKNEALSFESPNFKTYGSVLPPMIVIDNIDGPDAGAMSPVMMATSSTSANSNRLQDSSVRSSSTPLEDLDAAASEFRKQLSRNSMNASNPRHPSYSESFYGMNSSSALELGSCQSSLFGPNAEDEDDCQLIKGMVSEDWDGDDLFSPIPSNITTNDEDVEYEEDLLPNPEQTSNSSGSDEKEEVPSTTTMSTTIDTARTSRNYGTWDGIPSSPQQIVNLDAKLSSSMPSSMPMIMHRGTKSDVSLSKGLPPKRPPTPERGNTGTRPMMSDQQHRRPSFPKNTLISQNLGGDSSTMGEGHRRKSSSESAPDLPKNSSSISALSADDLLIGTSKSDGSNYNSSRLEFEAPRKGNWGLVLESSSKTGPRIYAVKDYSPLFGLVQKGDKLLEIDGKNVSLSNLTDVTKLLKGKSSSYPYSRPTSSTMPIVVSRSSNYHIDSSTAHGNAPNHRYDHKRNNSYGSYCSAGSSGSRVVEDVDDADSSSNNNNAPVYYLDHQQQQQIHHHHSSSFDYDSSNEI